MMTLHVTCCISEEAVHDEALRVDAVDQRVSSLQTHTTQQSLSRGGKQQPVQHAWPCPAHQAGLRGEDDDLVERSQLLEQVVDTWTLLEPPAGRELQTEGDQRDLRAPAAGSQPGPGF